MAALMDMGVVRLRLGNRQSLALDLEVPAQRGLGINTSLTVPRATRAYLRLRVNPHVSCGLVGAMSTSE